MISLVQIQRGGDARREEYQKKCTDCGACCAFFAREEGMITADGPAAQNDSLSYLREKKTTFKWPDGDEETVDQSGRVMRTQALHAWPACIALQGEVGRSVACSIYEERPSFCRAFEPGSLLCIAAREWAGISKEEVG